MRKKIIQCDARTHEPIAEFRSFAEAARSVPSANELGISRVCKGQQKTCGKFYWKERWDSEPQKKPESQPEIIIPTKIALLDVNGYIVAKHDSSEEIAEIYDVPLNTVEMSLDFPEIRFIAPTIYVQPFFSGTLNGEPIFARALYVADIETPEEAWALAAEIQSRGKATPVAQLTRDGETVLSMWPSMKSAALALCGYAGHTDYPDYMSESNRARIKHEIQRISKTCSNRYGKSRRGYGWQKIPEPVYETYQD